MLPGRNKAPQLSGGDAEEQRKYVHFPKKWQRRPYHETLADWSEATTLVQLGHPVVKGLSLPEATSSTTEGASTEVSEEASARLHPVTHTSPDTYTSLALESMGTPNCNSFAAGRERNVAGCWHLEDCRSPETCSAPGSLEIAEFDFQHVTTIRHDRVQQHMQPSGCLHGPVGGYHGEPGSASL
eukprot:g45446.t1